MSRIENIFKTLDRPAFIPFLMGGDPNYETGLEILKALPDAGADIIEIGMAFTDPVADGPIIQLAGERALAAGASIKKTLKLVHRFRQNADTPVVLMGYANPVFAYGVDEFAKDAADAGVDGLILVDLPPEESGEFETAFRTRGLDLIRLITPTTDEARLQTLLKGAGGFLYYVSIAGVTGTASSNRQAVRDHLDMIRQHTDLPVAVGFGIKTAEDAAQMSEIADAVVVGSALVHKIADTPDQKTLPQILAKSVAALSKPLNSLRKSSAA